MKEEEKVISNFKKEAIILALKTDKAKTLNKKTLAKRAKKILNNLSQSHGDETDNKLDYSINTYEKCINGMEEENILKKEKETSSGHFMILNEKMSLKLANEDFIRKGVNKKTKTENDTKKEKEVNEEWKKVADEELNNILPINEKRLDKEMESISTNISKRVERKCQKEDIGSPKIKEIKNYVWYELDKLLDKEENPAGVGLKST
ncbi:MAG: hypothetical protein ACOC5T_00310 [Elusimicrobiota bacterium]